MASPVLHLDNTLGALFLGNIVAAIFYGITSVQTYIYFKTGTTDKSFFKSLISFLWILDTIHIALVTHSLYSYCVSNFANPVALHKTVWSVMGQVYITCISDTIVRGIFSQRVWLLSRKNMWIIGVITILSLLYLISGFVFASQAFKLSSTEGLTTLKDKMYLALASGAAADATIAASIVTSLLKSRTGFKHTDRLITVLMVYAINTGLFTSVVRLLCLITFAAWPGTYIFVGLYYVLSKLSLNALLATLNARAQLREESYGINTVPVELGGYNHTAKFSDQTSGSSGRPDSEPSKLVICVDRLVETSGDAQARVVQ